MVIKWSSIIFLLLSLQSCISKECKDAPDLDFELSINYTPLKDTFRIGDTLFFNSTFSNILVDKNKAINQELVDFSFYSRIAFEIIENENIISINLEENDIIDIDVDYMLRAYSNNSEGILIDTHNYSHDKYRFSFGIIIRNLGLHYINVTSSLGSSNSTSLQKFEGQCPSQELTAFYKVNNGDAYENGFGFIENKAPYELVRDFNFNRFGGFAFYVKE